MAAAAMEHKPRWAEMCAQILRQCELVRGSREDLAGFLGVHPSLVAIWMSGRRRKSTGMTSVASPIFSARVMQ